MCVYFSSPALAEETWAVDGLLDGAKGSSAFHLKGVCIWKGHQNADTQCISLVILGLI